MVHLLGAGEFGLCSNAQFQVHLSRKCDTKFTMISYFAQPCEIKSDTKKSTYTFVINSTQILQAWRQLHKSFKIKIKNFWEKKVYILMNLSLCFWYRL